MPQTSVQPPDPTSPTLDVVAAVSALLLLGMLFGAALWVVAGITVAALVVLNHLLAKTWSSMTSAVRHGGDMEVKIGSQIPIRLDVTNHGRLPVLWLLVEDLLPRRALGQTAPALQIEGQRIKVMRLWGGETKPLTYQLRCRRRGYFQVGPTVLETGDVMGLYRRYRVTNDPQYITVMPEVVPLHSFQIGSRRPIGEIRMRESAMDDPTRLRGIRHWQPGDPMRSVHWAATARTGQLHSKVYEPSSIIGATLILDLHTSTTLAEHEPVRSDLAVTAAASIAALLHDQNQPVGLATNGRDAADRIRQEGWSGDHRVRGAATAAASMQEENDRLRPILLPPARGPLHLKDLHRTLARLERTNGLTLTELLQECESQLSADTTLLVILQRATEAGIGALVGLARRGRAVAVIINTHDVNDYSEIAGPLIAARISTHHLSSLQTVAAVCRASMLR